jgi:NAD(P)-dependent dehydrogenase (short-subunit alcohol dehydrogenase family)
MVTLTTEQLLLIGAMGGVGLALCLTLVFAVGYGVAIAYSRILDRLEARRVRRHDRKEARRIRRQDRKTCRAIEALGTTTPDRNKH